MDTPIGDCHPSAETVAAFMHRALDEARAAALRGEVPIGAVLVGPDGSMLAADGNRSESECDPTAHAEILVLRAGARRLGQSRLWECDLYVTLEPCPMCAHAITLARLRRLYFGAHDTKLDSRKSLFDRPGWRPEILGGIAERVAAELLRAFFRDLRASRVKQKPAFSQEVRNYNQLLLTKGSPWIY